MRHSELAAAPRQNSSLYGLDAAHPNTDTGRTGRHIAHIQRVCNTSYPAVDTWPAQLAEWVRYNPSPANKNLMSGSVATERSGAPGATAAPGACISAHCVSKRLAGRWIVFMGDSTHRALHDAFLQLLSERYGMDTLTMRPHLDGLPVKDRDRQKDTDTLALHDPRGYHNTMRARAGRAQREPECVGPLHPECNEKQPDIDWWANTSTHTHGTTRVSMRFLRGLDMHKLEHRSSVRRG